MGSAIMFSNSGSEKWEQILDTGIVDVSSAPVSEIPINQDDDGNTFSLKKVRILINLQQQLNTTTTLRIMKNGGGWSLIIGLPVTVRPASVYNTIVVAECEIIGTDMDGKYITRGTAFTGWDPLCAFSFNCNAGSYASQTYATISSIGQYMKDFYLRFGCTLDKYRILIIGVRG